MGLLTVAVAGVVGAGGAVVAAPLVLGAVGFTAGFWAAGLMPAANGGVVAAGVMVPPLQGAGAAGLGAAVNAAVAGAGGATAALLALFV